MHKAEWILIFMQTNKQKQNPQKKKHPSYVSLKNVNPLTSCSIWNIGVKWVNLTRTGRFWPSAAWGGLVGPPPIKSKLQMID